MNSGDNLLTFLRIAESSFMKKATSSLIAYQSQAKQENDTTFNVLSLLHTRACLTTSEVRALIVTGHASAALTRWRTLHELAVVSAFISKHGADVAERYRCHRVIQTLKTVEEVQKLSQGDGIDPIEPGVVDAWRRERDDLLQKYGAQFKGDYGWAADALGNKKPFMGDLERDVQLDRFFAFARLASNSVHPNSLGLTFNIQDPFVSGGQVAAPSIAGLAKPASLTLISLVQVTAAFFRTRASQPATATLQAIALLGNEAVGAFEAAEARLVEAHPDGLEWRQ